LKRAKGIGNAKNPILQPIEVLVEGQVFLCRKFADRICGNRFGGSGLGSRDLLGGSVNGPAGGHEYDAFDPQFTTDIEKPERGHDVLLQVPSHVEICRLWGGGVDQVEYDFVGLEGGRQSRVVGKGPLVPLDSLQRLGEMSVMSERTNPMTCRCQPPAEVGTQKSSTPEDNAGRSRNGDHFCADAKREKWWTANNCRAAMY
jgi:hypothetical protein